MIGQANQANDLDEVIVVLGRAANEIRRRVDFGSAKVVENPIFGEGCASSYRAGIGALDPQSEGVAIILGDQPGIDPETINRAVTEWRQSTQPIGLCSFRGRKGHPLLFAKSFFNQLIALHGDKAAWKLIDANPHLIHEVQFDSALPEDINTISDFGRLETTAQTRQT